MLKPNWQTLFGVNAYIYNLYSYALQTVLKLTGVQMPIDKMIITSILNTEL